MNFRNHDILLWQEGLAAIANFGGAIPQNWGTHLCMRFRRCRAIIERSSRPSTTSDAVGVTASAIAVQKDFAADQLWQQAA